MSPKNKPNRPKARLPRGFGDRRAGEIAATRRMVETIREVYERYGFEAVETPAIEYTDALGKFLPDQDRPNEGVFSFQDDHSQEARGGGAATGKGEWLSLRYDLTAPLARFVAENFDELPKPYRSYRFGWVFRNEKPGPGRFRQFMQFDADTVGSSSPAADAEMCMMAADTLETLGIPRGSYVIKVNNRKVLDGIREELGIEDEAQWLTVMRSIDKLDKFEEAEVHLLLTRGRRDQSGDVTKGAGLSDEQAAVILAKVRRYKGSNSEVLDMIRGSARASRTRQAGVDELQAICSFTGPNWEDRIRIDPSVVRGLEYYTGPVFEAELTFEINDEDGRPMRFGSVGGGGRYDGLVSRFRGEAVPATGFSIGVSRLQAALTALGKLGADEEQGPVVVTVFDKDRLADYQRMVQQLREAGMRAELYLGNPRNFGNQLKYADKRRSPCVVIQGSDEKARGEVQIKDLIEGAKAAAAIASNEEYREARLAQFAVPEDKLVEAVREVLARHRR